MSVSSDDRRENVSLALRLLLGHIPANRPYEWEQIQTDTPDFAGVYPTTWRDLERSGYVAALRYGKYRLTASGWIAALKASGEFDSPNLRQMAGRLSRALKDRVKSRTDDELVSRSELEKDTGLSEAWIYDAVDSHLLFHLFGRRDAAWARGDNTKNYIVVPIDFGLAENI